MINKKILICGATGFIGRNLVEFFAQIKDFDVVAVYHQRPTYEISGVQWVRADLTDAQDVERVVQGVAIVIQGAATTSGSKDIVNSPYIHVTDNAVMNSLLLRAAFEAKVSHFIFFSCSVMYQSSAKQQREIDYSEADEIHPRYFGVGWTKVYVEKMCEFFATLGGMKVSVIRHSNIYGPYDKFDLEKSHVMGASITKVLRSEGVVQVWGDGSEKRDLLHVDDLMDAVSLILEKQGTNFELYNIGSGNPISIKDLITKIIKTADKHVTLEFDLSKPTIKTDIALDCSKAKRELEWTPKVSLEEGIAKTIQWCSEKASEQR